MLYIITPKILKTQKIITFLISLFNARLSYFPKIWKIYQIIMIHKPEKPAKEASSYRPITLTPVLSKLCEKKFEAHLRDHIELGYIILKHQFGFSNCIPQ